MGRVRKTNIKDCWSTNPTKCIHIFPQNISRHLAHSDSSVFKIQPVREYFLWKLRSVYRPEREYSLYEGMIPWRSSLEFEAYNPGKIIKYGLLVRSVCEAKS
jgi:hypothetical protein